MKLLSPVLTLLLTSLVLVPAAQARDLGFRYKNGKCTNEAGVEGLNVSYFGQCGDFRNLTLNKIDLSETDFSGSNFEGADLRDANFSGSIFVGANFQMVLISGSDFSKAVFKNSNFSGLSFERGSLAGASFRSSRLIKSSFRYADLRGADLSFADMNEADLRNADLTKALVEKTDFTKAVFNKSSKLPFDNRQAEKLGMIFKNTGDVLVLWDIQDDNFKNLMTALEKSGAKITLSPKIENEFNGMDMSSFTHVLFFGGRIGNCGDDMTLPGQDALVNFVRNGGTFIHTEWATCRFFVSKRLQKMRDILMFDRTSESGGIVKLSIAKSGHPLLAGITEGAEFDAHYNTGAMHAFGEQPGTVLLTGANNPMMAVREFGKGKVIGFGFTCNNVKTCGSNPTVQRLMSNAVNEDF